MLTLDLGLTRERKAVLLGKLRTAFSTYFGFMTSGSLAEAAAMAQAIGEQRQTELQRGGPGGEQFNVGNQGNAIHVQSRLNVVSDPAMINVFKLFLDASEGARRAILTEGGIVSLKDSLVNLLTTHDTSHEQSSKNTRNIERCVCMHYCQSAAGAADQNQSVYLSDLDTIGFSPADTGNGQATADIRRSLSAFEMIHPVMVPGEKNAELLTVFFNAFPALELTRATPVLNIKIYSSRQVEQDGKLGAITLHKFLEGAAEINSPSLRAINLASQVSASFTGESASYSLVGMELFKAPQTLVNLDAVKNKDNYLAPVIDPMRPLASIKSLDIEVRSNVGLLSTKTAKLEIVLHDRSRMGEFADFIKPDRYGSSFLEIEYGWSHPDAVDLTGNNIGNPYAQLLNLTRVREHYGIMASSFSFDDVGQVNISLSLYTRGSAEMAEIPIVNDSPDLRNQISNLENFSRNINQLADRAFGRNRGTGEGTQRQEIRGQQMLNAAGDATNYLVLSRELFTSLGQLRTAAREAGRSPSATPAQQQAAQELTAQINRLVGSTAGTGTGRNLNTTLGNDSLLSNIQANVNQQIANALNLINSGGTSDGTHPYDVDIFLKRMPSAVKEKLQTIDRRADGLRSESDAQAQLTHLPSTSQPQGGGNGASAGPRSRTASVVSRQSVVSLGSLIMSFVAKPLANAKDPLNPGSNKFSEVQVYFYNFNNKASMMSHCNISQFPVFTDFFAREYSRQRLENTSRAVRFTVSEFISFLANRIIDDPMNPAYNIASLYRQNADNNATEPQRAQERSRNGRNVEISVDEFNRRMEAQMLDPNIGNVSGSPDFVMPQITFEMEAVPDAADPRKTILKLHVYDRVCSPNSSVRDLLNMSNTNLLSTMSAFPGAPGTANELVEQQAGNDASQSRLNQTRHNLRNNWADIHRAVVRYAETSQIIRPMPNTNPVQYRFVGGPKRLKEMVMRFVPHIIYGAMGSTVKNATLNSKQDPLLASMNMVRSLNADPIMANGEQIGGVPLSVYPIDLSITTLGCPFVRYAQEMFIDFNTNTTADNIYYVTGLQHHFEAGQFDTTIKFTANDAFGQYRNFISQLNNAGQIISSLSGSTR